MAGTRHIDAIREKIRTWMQEPVADETSTHGKALQDSLRAHWPEVFADSPNRPVTNRDVMTITSIYLSNALAFVRDYDNEDDLMEKFAEFADTTTADLHKLHNQTDITEKNLRQLQIALHALYRQEELSFTDMIHHLAATKEGAHILRRAEEIVTGGQSLGAFIDSQPAQAALMDALDHAVINFNYLKIRQTIEGSLNRSGGEAQNE